MSKLENGASACTHAVGRGGFQSFHQRTESGIARASRGNEAVSRSEQASAGPIHLARAGHHWLEGRGEKTGALSGSAGSRREATKDVAGCSAGRKGERRPARPSEGACHRKEEGRIQGICR